MVVTLMNKQLLQEPGYYILKNKEPAKTNVLEWFSAKKCDNYVAKDIIGDSQIITFFYGLINEDLAKLFHTIVIDGDLDGENESYSTWQEAEIGHKIMVERVKSKL